MTSQRRFRLFADTKIQGGLCIRIIFYWVLCQVAFTTVVLFGAALSSVVGTQGDAASTWLLVGPALAVSTLLLPVAMFDMLVYSNKFAGPLLRFRRNFHQLATGQEVRPLHFRDGDLLCDLSRDFNLIREQQLESGAAEATADREESAAAEVAADQDEGPSADSESRDAAESREPVTCS